MKIDSVYFSDEFIKGFQSEKEFVKHMQAEGYQHIFAGNDRDEKLKKAYQIHSMKE